MRQQILPTAFLSFVYLLAVALGQQPVSTPPGRPLPLKAPTIAAPAVEEVVEPTPEVPFEIVATVGGKIIEEDHVALPVGKLLTFKVRGLATLPVDGGPVPAVAWTLNQPTDDLSVYPADGHHLTFTAPADGVYLFHAAINNPDPFGAPLVAQRWVVVGKGSPTIDEPTTPTDPAPAPQPPKPSTAPVDLPGFRALLLFEAGEGMPDAFASHDVADYLNAKTVKGEDGETPEWRRHDDDTPMKGDFDSWEAYRAAAPADCGRAAFPDGYVVTGNGAEGYAGPAPKDAADLLALLKKYGG
jgi:hypothetical protein